MKRIAKSLITALLLSSLTLPPSYGLDNSDPYFSECARIGDLGKRTVYANFYVDFVQFVGTNSQKTKKQKLEYKKLLVEQKKLLGSFNTYNSEVSCGPLTVDQWLSIREDRLNALKTAEEYIIKMMQKYPFTTVQCFKNGIPQDVRGINPVCPKGTKQI
jgi:hypothetical protein